MNYSLNSEISKNLLDDEETNNIMRELFDNHIENKFQIIKIQIY